MSETKLPPLPKPAAYVTDLRDGAHVILVDEDDIGIAVYTAPQLEACAEAARLEERERAYQQAYTDALSHAAFYVNDHCQQGEHHAEIIVGLKRPDAAAIRKGE